jgi:hypothetical protein
MGGDLETEYVMAGPPRKLTERGIDKRMWAGVVEIFLAVLTLGFAGFQRGQLGQLERFPPAWVGSRACFSKSAASTIRWVSMLARRADHRVRAGWMPTIPPYWLLPRVQADNEPSLERTRARGRPSPSALSGRRPRTTEDHVAVAVPMVPGVS